MDISVLATILTASPPSHRYIAMVAHQSMSTYATHFGTPVPEWVKAEAKGHIAALCKTSMELDKQIPASKPSEQAVRSFLDEQKQIALQEALKKWGGLSEFPDKLVKLIQGPYNELLEASLFLNRMIHESLKKASSEDQSAWEQVEIDVFGDPESLFKFGDSGWAEFRASRMNGPGIDVFDVSGLPRTDDLNDGVWGKTNWVDLFSWCPEVYLQELETIDEVPGQSDTYFTVNIFNARKFARELRVAMLSYTVYSDGRACRATY
jgi:hypothetical protein